jgi:hypothetical protein
MEGVRASFSCQFCFRRFARKYAYHMHGDVTCINADFQFSDALKRHWNTCKNRKRRALDIPTLNSKTRGRKIRACDQCSRLKRGCTSTEPCTQCALRGQPCTYKRWRLDRTIPKHQEEPVNMNSRVAMATDVDGLLFENNDNSNMFLLATDSYPLKSAAVNLDCWDASRSLLNEHILATSMYLHPTQLDIRTLSQFPFLDNFTKTKGFATSFGCGSREQRLLIPTESSISKSLGHLLSFESHNSRPSTHWVEITRDALNLHDDHYMRDANVLTLLPKTHEIVSQVREIAVLKHHQGPIDMTWSTSLEALCYEFFHPIALQRHLALFWSCWYPNWPAIHRPTFDAAEKSPALVAAMALVGASLSPDCRDCAASQVWFNVVEEMVFSNEVFGDDDVSNSWDTSNSTTVRRLHVDILQAAYCVCLYQTWEGCKRSKRRILRQRFNDLVYVGRLQSTSRIVY